MDDLLREFLTETSESLDVADVELVKFERDPNNREILNNIFRLVHTIKGTCGFIGLSRLAALAHAAETLMDKFREGIPVTPDAVSLVLVTIDRVKLILTELEISEGIEPEGSDADLIDELLAMATDPPAAAEVEEELPSASVVQMGTIVHQTLERELLPGEVSLDELERLFRQTEVEVVPPKAKASAKSPPPKAAAKEKPAAKEKAPAKEKAAAKDKPIAVVKTVAENEPATAAKRGDDENAPGTPIAAQSIRVSVGMLEHLMTMVSELVLTRNQLLEIARRNEDHDYKVSLQRLSNVTGELQDAIMRTRMQPIGNAWQKLPRIVRDLAQELGKQVDLQMTGSETELDRQVLDQIKDPLTHMVRNSADHGLEFPDDRRRAGKPEKGVIRLSAYHEGGFVIVKISDDGKGLDLARIKAKALENGLADEAELAKMSEGQIFRFIFAAGFSTAAKVTSVSGRGVGMDVVRANIESIGGTVDVQSKAGVGSTFIIKIPLTLAIMPALIVEVSGERFAIPQNTVLELVRIQADSEHAVRRLNDAPVLCLRNQLLPMLHLGRLLGLDAGKPEGYVDEDFENRLIAVMDVGNERFGIVLDSVSHTEEIVVKPMSSVLRQVSLVSGSTILGDGHVIMIVDPNGLAQAVAAGSEASMTSTMADAVQQDTSDAFMSLLLFSAGSDDIKAVPLSLVTRLEELERDTIEKVDGRAVIQYRGKLIPVIRADGELAERGTGTQPMLIFSHDARVMGLAVDKIVDIVESSLDLQLSSSSPHVLGGAIIDGRATEILDVGYFLSMALGEENEQEQEAGAQPRLLLVDDSPFYRNLIQPVLRGRGYSVTACASAQEALERLTSDSPYDAIISDVEMPGMDGFRFAEMVRGDLGLTHVPIIAMAGSNPAIAIQRGRAAGFTECVSKFDRPGLISALQEFTGQEFTGSAEGEAA
ncbi:chemotaxis protein CheW [Aquabacter sp. CN5-332]|uniref:hybrid sensor histidine kinase/response regulator n=1 Tax=Aquabacter sp. CN5-332 TaxID=3156608 RepID=UPI0032B4762B